MTIQSGQDLPMDDPSVLEVLTDLQRTVSASDIERLCRSLTVRGLWELWTRCTQKPWTDGGKFGSEHLSVRQVEPSVGMRWICYLALLSSERLPVLSVLRLLEDAGVLGSSWPQRARASVCRDKGWM